MGKAQRLTDVSFQQGHSQARRTSLEVPADWYVDPADPQGAQGANPAGSIEDQTTAFLAAAEEAESQTNQPLTSGTVTALSEAPSRRTESAPDRITEAPQDSVWLGIPSLIPTEQVEGELAWQVDALCAQTDPEAFFPEKGGSTRDAKKVCSACHVKQECLDYALANDERFGIWGGLSERERRKLKKRSA